MLRAVRQRHFEEECSGTITATSRFNIGGATASVAYPEQHPPFLPVLMRPLPLLPSASPPRVSTVL